MLNWLLVGTGDIVRKRAAAALATAPGGRLVGVCGGRERAEAIAREHGAAEVYDNLADALARTSADSVYVATPVFRHREEATRALAAGRHVLVEKPLGVTGADARALAAAAAAAGVTAGCAYYRRLTPRYAHACDLLASGKLGRIVLVRMIYWAGYNPEPADPKFWRVSKSLAGGGPLADMGSHMLDILIGLRGMPARVYAKAGTLVHRYEVEDSAATLLTMPDGTPVSADFGWSSKAFSHEMEIVGSEGKLRWSPHDTGPVTLTLGRDTRELDLPPAANVHGPLIEDFNRAVADRRPPASPLDEAARVNTLIDAIYRSAETGREVTP
jgi:predicted dehydrogenase